MNRAETIGLSVFVATALLSDSYFTLSRCACSPAIHATGVAVGLLAQAMAVSIPLVVSRLFQDSSLKFRLRALGIGLFSCVISLPAMETAILFGDTIGEGKGFASSSYACDYGRLFPDGMPPNKRVQATCETHAPDA